MLKCLECEKKLKERRYLIDHVNKYHNLTIKEYDVKHNINFIQCSGCDNIFYSLIGNSLYCTGECRDKKYDQDRQDLLKKGIENEDYITCQWCNSAQRNLSLIHFNRCSPGKTINEYKKEFPNHLTMAINYKKAILDNGGGVHMKLDKYRKMASEQIKGDKNPNHKSKTTIEQRRAISPFSKEFYRKDNPEMGEEELQKLTNGKVKEYIKDRISDTSIEYYLNKGYSQIEAQQKLSERQTTFSLEICIKKYGEEAGLKRWQERQKKWLDSTAGSNHSSVSQKLFWDLHNTLTNKEDLYFKELNKEYVIIGDSNTYVVDFKHRNKVIEFNGDYWHANPNKYNESWINTTINLSAKDIWEKDSIRNDIISKDYDLLIIWEYDYKNDPEGTLQKCIKFLND